MKITAQVADQEWAQRVQALSAEERERRLQTVNALLREPEDISDGLESELYILRDRLTGQDAA